MSEIDFTERRRFKGDKRWFGRCDDCNDFEFYPVKEHRKWHELYERLEGYAWGMESTAFELWKFLGYKRPFIFKDNGHNCTVKVKVTGSILSPIIEPKSAVAAALR